MEIIAVFFYGLAFLVALAFWGPSVLCAFLAAKRLLRNFRDPIGYVWLIGVFVGPAIMLVTLLVDENRVEQRRIEVASWPRIEMPAPLPRTLIIHTRRTDPSEATYVLGLAAFKLFDIFLLADRKTFKAEFANQADCLRARQEHAALVTEKGLDSCIIFVPADNTPPVGLVLYDGHRTAPLAEKYFGSSGEPFERANWAIQLSYRHNGTEELIAYEESIRQKKMRRWGPLYWPALEDRPTERISATVTQSYRPDPAEFLYKHLGDSPSQLNP